jgi:hypothetical protein
VNPKLATGRFNGLVPNHPRKGVLLTQLGDEILREIASVTFMGQDNKGPRTFSTFLIKFSELAPRLMLK